MLGDILDFLEKCKATATGRLVIVFFAIFILTIIPYFSVLLVAICFNMPQLASSITDAWGTGIISMCVLFIASVVVYFIINGD